MGNDQGYFYSIISIEPEPYRSERTNVGFLIWYEENFLAQEIRVILQDYGFFRIGLSYPSYMYGMAKDRTEEQVLFFVRKDQHLHKRIMEKIGSFESELIHYSVPCSFYVTEKDEVEDTITHLITQYIHVPGVSKHDVELMR